jgi:hypothetical protein
MTAPLDGSNNMHARSDRRREFAYGVSHSTIDGFFRAEPQVGNFVGCPSLIAKAGVTPQDGFNPRRASSSKRKQP